MSDIATDQHDENEPGAVEPVAETRDGDVADDVLERGAIPSHSTDVVDEPWDKNAEVSAIPNDAGSSTLRRMYAWVDPEGDADTKSAYKFPHHKVEDGKPTAANINGVRAALARVNQKATQIPDNDREPVRAHLQRHMRDYRGSSGDSSSSTDALARGAAEAGLLGDELRERHVVRYVTETPWAVTPTMLEVIAGCVNRWMNGDVLSDEEIAERVGDRAPQRELQMEGAVAVIPIYGVIAPRMGLFTRMSGGTSMEQFMQDFREAINDPDVGAILLDVDSPGGSVELVPEAASVILANRDKKPVVAIANTSAFSAAYWLASQANELVVTPSGEVGSIGVYTIHQDVSGQLAQAGIKTTIIKAGDHKIEANPFESLSPEAAMKMQDDVDSIYEDFVAAVAAGRKVSVKKVLADFGEGRTIMSKPALVTKMVDRIATYDDTLKRLQQVAASRVAAKDKGKGAEHSSEGAVTLDGTPITDAIAQSRDNDRPPRDGLFRAVDDIELLERSEDDGRPIMHGHLAVFDRWTEINSVIEGHFLESFAPGAFKRTIDTNRPQMRVLFQHGKDPRIGSKPLGPITDLREDEKGAAYEVALLDAPYVREDVLPGLRAGVYGSSFRFRILREKFDRRPGKSAHNPKGLPERRVLEAQVFEFGPVTFPQYVEATAGVRSLTDEFQLPDHLRALAGEPERLREVVSRMHRQSAVEEQEPGPVEATPANEPALVAGEAVGPGQSPTPPASTHQTKKEEKTMRKSIAELRARLGTIEKRMEELKPGEDEMLSDEERDEFVALAEEYEQIDASIKEDGRIRAAIDKLGQRPEHVEREADPEQGRARVLTPPKGDDVYRLDRYRVEATSAEEFTRLQVEGAKAILERSRFGGGVDAAATLERIGQLLALEEDRIDVQGGFDVGDLATRIIVTGSPTYKRAFTKQVMGAMLTTEEMEELGSAQRALATFTDSAGGFAVPYEFDPTVILTSRGAINPIREISRVETITSREWRGIASAGITAGYGAEGSEFGDNAPSFSQPVLNPERAGAFVPYSIEIGQDWPRLQTEITRMLVQAKDELEANKFLTGLGHASQEPQGLLVGATAVVLTAATATTAVGDVYALVEALPERWRQNGAVFIGNLSTYDTVRQFDTGGGASLWVRLADGMPPRLIGWPAYEDSYMPTGVTTTGRTILTYGDFSQFLIIDRVGMMVENIQTLFGPNRRPTGQRGLLAVWRNTSGVLVPDAFRSLKVR